MKLLLTSILLILTLYVSSQDKAEYDTTYIKSFYDKFVVTFVALNRSNTITFYNDEKETTLKTNTPLNLGIGVDYKWFTAELSLPLKDEIDNEVVNTKGFGLKFGVTQRKWLFYNYYLRFKGYNNVDSEDREGKSPNFSTESYRLTATYGLNNKRYSNIATFWQLDRQRKSAGSLIFGANFSFDRLNFAKKSSIRPETEYGHLNKMRGINYGVKLGYAYTFVFKNKLHISASVLPGLIFHNGRYYAEEKRYAVNNKINLLLDSFIGLGFNGDKVYYGINYLFNNNYAKFSNIDIEFQYSFLRLYYGIRLTLPKKTYIKALKL